MIRGGFRLCGGDQRAVKTDEVCDRPLETCQCNGPTFEQSLDILHIPHDRAQEYMTTRLTAELALVPTVNRLFPGVREMLQTLREYADLTSSATASVTISSCACKCSG